jgi:hypothetical protein
MCACNKPVIRQDLTAQAAQALIDQAAAAQRESAAAQAPSS